MPEGEGNPGRRRVRTTGMGSARVPRLAGFGVARPSALVLVLPGGRADGPQAAHRWQPAYLRMWPFASDLGRAGRRYGVSAGLLRYRNRGWNGTELDPVRDLRWALDRLRRLHPEVPVVLLGHSMGGRAALRAAGDPGVVAVGALAPWVEAGDPVEQLADRTVLIAHGDRDEVTDPERSYAYAVRARRVTSSVCRFELAGEGHAMLRRPRDWTALTRHFVLTVCGAEPLCPAVAAAFASPEPAGLRLRYPPVPRAGLAERGRR
jgi:pimeloyl-ACP methyl ester carboxylesterase